MFKRRLIIMLIFMLGACSAIGVAKYITCSTDIPLTTIPEQSMDTFSNGKHDVSSLVISANNFVSNNVGSLANTHIGFVIASFLCERRNCQLEEFQAEILATRISNCSFLDFPNSPGYITLTNYIFDINNNSVRASSVPTTNMVTDPIAWEDMPIDINEAVEIALNQVGDEFIGTHTEFRLTVSRQFNYWSASFNSHLQDEQAPEIRLKIDNSTGEILEDNRYQANSTPPQGN